LAQTSGSGAYFASVADREQRVAKKQWRKPELKTIRAGEAENGRLNGNDNRGNPRS